MQYLSVNKHRNPVLIPYETVQQQQKKRKMPPKKSQKLLEKNNFKNVSSTSPVFVSVLTSIIFLFFFLNFYYPRLYHLRLGTFYVC
jgi:hypothetical protein